MNAFKGTGVAMVTPFSEDFSIDIPALRRITDHLINGGINYLVILGTTGEAATLSAEEKHLVIQTILDQNNGRIPAVIGCGGNNTAEVVNEIQLLTEKYSPDGFLSVSPYYNKPSQEGIFQHFKAVCNSTEKPVILYNVPGRTSSNILPGTVIQITTHCPNAVAVKEASGNLEQGMDIISGSNKGFSVLSGDDILGLPMIASGYQGVISVMGNAMPKEYSSMVQYALAGEFDKARSLHYQMKQLMQLNFAEGNPAGVKALMSLLGLCSPQVRLPLVKASVGLMETIRAELILS